MQTIVTYTVKAEIFHTMHRIQSMFVDKIQTVSEAHEQTISMLYCRLFISTTSIPFLLEKIQHQDSCQILIIYGARIYSQSNDCKGIDKRYRKKTNELKQNAVNAICHQFLLGIVCYCNVLGIMYCKLLFNTIPLLKIPEQNTNKPVSRFRHK